MTEELEPAPWDNVKRDVTPANDAQLPLAPPARPLLLNATALRVAFIDPEDSEQPGIDALQVSVDGTRLSALAAKLRPGRVEVAFTSGFGATRTLQLSAAEFVLLISQGQAFMEELPR